MNQSKSILNSWFSLVSRIQMERAMLTSISLANRLMDWSLEIEQEYRGGVPSQFFQVYVKPYSDLNQANYQFNVCWYDLDELTTYDLVKPKPNSVKRVFEIINLVLNEIFTFRSDMECPHCDNEYRAHMDQDSLFYLYCDQCNDYKGVTESALSGKWLIPASSAIVNQHKLSNYSPR